jgi:hypothetical protein
MERERGEILTSRRGFMRGLVGGIAMGVGFNDATNMAVDYITKVNEQANQRTEEQERTEKPEPDFNIKRYTVDLGGIVAGGALAVSGVGK